MQVKKQMNDILKIISVIGVQCIITLFLLLFCRFRVIPYYLQTMLAFFLGGIGFLLEAYVLKVIGDEMYWFCAIWAVMLLFTLILMVRAKILKKNIEEVVVNIPEGSYHVITVDAGRGSNVMLQYHLYYKEACYILLGAMPQNGEAVVLYAYPTKDVNTFKAAMKNNRKDIKWTFKKRERWLHDRLMVLYWYLAPILVAWVGVENQITKYIPMLALLGLCVWYFRGAKGLFFRMLYFFCRGMELFLYFAFVFLSLMELLHQPF